MNPWADALDRYEAALAHHEAVLAGEGGRGGPHPWPPPVLPTGGVPPAHHERARQLLARSEELARRLTAHRDSLPPLTSGWRMAPRAQSATPRRVDRSM